MEIREVTRLREWLAEGRPLGGLRLQDLDLTGVADELLAHRDLEGLVVLGGFVPGALRRHLQDHGAVIFPAAPTAPVDIFRAHLYTARELYAGLDSPRGYLSTVDFRAYEWSRDARHSRDAYATLLRAIHDDSITDALDEWVEGRRVVGVLGGHAALRGTGVYAEAAQLGHDLAGRGLLVATGGGPGTMEAVNLGATAPSSELLDQALVALAAVPSFEPDVGVWAAVAFAALASFGPRMTPLGSTPRPEPEAGSPRRRPRSLGIPTWFYGHEPPNVFAEGIAKYFSNAIREDGLLARSTAGVVVLPGAAGTVQEVFQLATRLYYAPADLTPPPLVLVGRQHWTRTLPVVDLLTALGAGRPLGSAVHVVDTVEEAADLVAPG